MERARWGNSARWLAAALCGALVRTRTHTMIFLLIHLCAVLVGATMVHRGNTFALGRRDAIVGEAYASDPAAQALVAGDRPRAALLDAGRNLLLGAAPLTIAGIGIVVPYPLVAYRGWVGGIVAVDGQHRSRLREPREATYYLVTLLLQLVPYSIAGGAGVGIGWAYVRSRGVPSGPTWLGFPRQPCRDALALYVGLVQTLTLVANSAERSCLSRSPDGGRRRANGASSPGVSRPTIRPRG